MKIRLPISGQKGTKDPERRHFEKVLGIQGGASPRGSSFWKQVRLCPRESGLQQAGLKRDGFLPGRVALDMGLVWHHALEAYYRALMDYQEANPLTMQEHFDRDFGRYCVAGQVPAERAAWEALTPFQGEPGYEDISATVTRMLGGYFEFWRPQERFKILGVEETLEYVGEGDPGDGECYPFRYSTRLDTLVEDLLDGGMWILEHKSATALTDSLMSGYQLDLQILGQVWCAEGLVDECAREDVVLPPFKGVIVNIATKGLKPQYARIRVSPSPAHMQMFEDAAAAQAVALALWESLGWPKHLGACNGGGRYFQTCQYFDVCLGHPLDTVEELTQNPPFGFDVATNETNLNQGEP